MYVPVTIRSPAAAFVDVGPPKNMKPAKADNTTQITTKALRVLVASSLSALPIISSPAQMLGTAEEVSRSAI
ncbi:MAG: hypothetical protein A3K76_01945 [Euryarchaeota archaeon RBG_13_57_23]|nr:MAG: hypothetical protein A3K76_01945 [Euryarchaeota archaeon RBG_13_57_23]